jgi:uncharacterized iron-regulated protein
MARGWLAGSEYKVAVGMEMFQVPYQKVLDDYTAGLISEQSFLKQSPNSLSFLNDKDCIWFYRERFVDGWD